MNMRAGQRSGYGFGGRKFRIASAVFTLLASPLVLGIGCGDTFDQKFRQASLDSIETGVKSILDGVVSGIFAANHDDSSSTSSSTSSDSTSASTAP